MADILSELRAENTEQSELETLLLGYFGQGSHTAENELSFGRGGEDCCLKLRYNDVGTLVAIDEGPGLRPADIQTLRQKVEDELLSTGPMTTVRRVLFASVPTDAAFRYKNEFQILPVPPEAPRPGQIVGEHPFLLEYPLSTSSNFMVTMGRQERAAREYELILSSLLAFRIIRASPIGQFHWVIEPPHGAGITSKYLQGLYTWPKHNVRNDAFHVSMHTRRCSASNLKSIIVCELVERSVWRVRRRWLVHMCHIAGPLMTVGPKLRAR